ncbi:MAG: hypothetical protein Q9213_007045 [Squamulea squamosa]
MRGDALVQETEPTDCDCENCQEANQATKTTAVDLGEHLAPDAQPPTDGHVESQKCIVCRSEAAQAVLVKVLESLKAARPRQRKNNGQKNKVSHDENPAEAENDATTTQFLEDTEMEAAKKINTEGEHPKAN